MGTTLLIWSFEVMHHTSSAEVSRLNAAMLETGEGQFNQVPPQDL